jgi:hypothetical protein
VDKPYPRRRLLGRGLTAGLLALALSVGLLGSGPALAARSTSTATIGSVTCKSTGGPANATYSVASSSATANVEVRWKVFSGQVITVGITYVVLRYYDRPANTVLTAPAPSGYNLNSVTVIPISKSGRQVGTADSRAFSCPAPA